MDCGLGEVFLMVRRSHANFLQLVGYVESMSFDSHKVNKWAWKLDVSS